MCALCLKTFRSRSANDGIRPEKLNNNIVVCNISDPAYPPHHGPHAPLRYGPRPAPLRQAPPPPQDVSPAGPAPDGRTEFRMHGMKGPHSYQFGYDTGKGYVL